MDPNEQRDHNGQSNQFDSQSSISECNRDSLANRFDNAQVLPEYIRMADEFVQMPDNLEMGPFAEWIVQERTSRHAYQERSDPMAYCGPLAVEGTVNVLYGPPGGLKTMLEASNLLHVAAGVPWPNKALGDTSNAKWPVVLTRTLLIDYDNGRRLTDDRAEAMLRQMNLGPDFDNFRWLSYAQPRLNLGETTPLNHFRTYVRSQEYKMIGIDGLSTVLPAGVKMTEEGARVVLDGLRYVAYAMLLTILVQRSIYFTIITRMERLLLNLSDKICMARK